MAVGDEMAGFQYGFAHILVEDPAHVFIWKSLVNSVDAKGK